MTQLPDQGDAERVDPPTDQDRLDRLEAVYRDEHAGAVRLAHLLVGDRARGEDLVHDAFVRLHRHLDRTDNPAGYLRTTLVNLCRDHHRREATARRHQPAPPEPVPPPDLPLSTSAVWRSLQNLPPRQREAIVLRYWADLPTDEIARLLDARPSTARSLLHRALATLKETLDDV